MQTAHSAEGSFRTIRALEVPQGDRGTSAAMRTFLRASGAPSSPALHLFPNCFPFLAPRSQILNCFLNGCVLQCIFERPWESSWIQKWPMGSNTPAPNNQMLGPVWCKLLTAQAHGFRCFGMSGFGHCPTGHPGNKEKTVKDLTQHRIHAATVLGL